MKRKETILKNIEQRLKLNKEDSLHFFNCAKGYINAVKQNRMICNIEHVSSSGMTRYMTFNYLEKSKYDKNRYNLLNTYFLFKCLGYRYNEKHYAFLVSGCGMDMVFHTNYYNIHELFRLGFLSKKDCDKLAQITPQTI